MQKLGAFIIGRSKLALWGFIALILFSTIWGFQAFSGLKAGGYDDPGSDSARVVELLREGVVERLCVAAVVAVAGPGVEQGVAADERRPVAVREEADVGARVARRLETFELDLAADADHIAFRRDEAA